MLSNQLLARLQGRWHEFCIAKSITVAYWGHRSNHNAMRDTMNKIIAHTTIAVGLLGLAQSAFAQDCQVLDQFPAEIDRPGKYCIDQSHDVELTGNAAAIAIRADDVDLDLAGHTLRQGAFRSGACNPEFIEEPTIGVLIFESRNVKVHGGALRCFNTGVQISQGLCGDCNSGNRVEGMRIHRSFFAGIHAEGRYSVYTDNHIVDTGLLKGRDGIGIYSSGDGNTVRNNDIQQVRGEQSQGIGTGNSNNSLIVENRVQNASIGFLLFNGRNVRFRDNLTAATSTPYSGFGTDLGNND